MLHAYIPSPQEFSSGLSTAEINTIIAIYNRVFITFNWNGSCKTEIAYARGGPGSKMRTALAEQRGLAWLRCTVSDDAASRL